MLQQAKCKLLVVDDHSDTREILARLLSRSSFVVSTARCFDSAVALAEVARPDVVISDLGLPGRDGVALMRELSRRHGVRGIAVSGHRIEDDSALREAGFVAHLLKPIAFDQLLRVIDQVRGDCTAAAKSAAR